MSKNKFDFYEVVKVVSNKPNLQEINGKEGTIIGMSKNEQTGNWGYAVTIHESEDGWDILECDLRSTGKKRKREEFYTGETVKVRVDPETGESILVDDED